MKKIKNSLFLSIAIPVISVTIVYIIVSLILSHQHISSKPMNINIKTIPNTKQFNLTELTSLKNYSFLVKDNNLTFNGSVFSTNNWSIKQPVLEEHINHFIYIELNPNNWYRQTEGNNNYNQSPFITTAKNFLNFYHVSGAHLAPGKTCLVDNIQGSIYSFFGPSLHKKNTTTLLSSACLATHNHYLLAFNLGTSTDFMNLKSKNINFGFRITSINQTKKLVPPNHFKPV